MYKNFCIIALCTMLTGCGLMDEKTVQPLTEPSNDSPVVVFMTQNEPGASSSLTDGNFGGNVRVTMEESFLSAGNELCKRATVLSSQQEAEIVVICRPAYSGDDGAWRLAPRVWGNGAE